MHKGAKDRYHSNYISTYKQICLYRFVWASFKSFLDQENKNISLNIHCLYVQADHNSSICKQKNKCTSQIQDFSMEHQYIQTLDNLVHTMSNYNSF